MKVKYFSEVLNKYYDSEEEVLEAEKEFNERKLKEENKKKELANLQNNIRNVKRRYFGAGGTK